MKAEIFSINKLGVEEYGNSLLVKCHPFVDSHRLDGDVDISTTIILLVPNNDKNLRFLEKAKNDPILFFEFSESAFEKKCISIGNCYIHKSLLGIKSNSNDSGNAIDLGLSVLWADKNVGALSPLDYGSLYKFNDISESCYYYSFERYNDPENDSAKKAIDDFVKNKWGNEWRMPTTKELEELCKQCSWRNTNKDGVVGCEVTGPNSNSIFLPFAGVENGRSTYRKRELGEIWAGDYSKAGWNVALVFHGSRGHIDYSANPSWGNSIRPVKDKKG